MSSSAKPKTSAITIISSWIAPHILSVIDSPQRIFGGCFKESAHRFVHCKPLYNRKNIILQRCQGCCSNLRSKVVCLAFSQPQQSFHLFKYDFLGAYLDINPICFKKVELDICSYQATPNTILTSLNKEQTNFGICKVTSATIQ